MSRISDVVLLLAALALAAGSARADDVATYLDRLDLDSVLAVHLEDQLDDLVGAEKEEVVIRLAALYAELLETTQDDAYRQSLENRSRRLLGQVPADTALELRLALLRGSFRSAEKIAERHRLRQADDESVEEARQAFGELTPQLGRLGEELDRRRQTAERRRSRAAGAGVVVRGEEASRFHGLYSQCTFLNAWAMYYHAWLNDAVEHARVAEGLFGELLASESSYPRPEDVSIDLRSEEPIARAILGLALCRSISSTASAALEWIDLLEHPDAFGPLRAQTPVWRLAIHLENNQFLEARRILAEEYEKHEDGLSLLWVRLGAVHALEHAAQDHNARQLGRWAVAHLASRGELAQISDLARRYGIEALGDSGFAIRYVSGVQLYEAARAEHGHERPIIDQNLVGQYEEAVHQFEVALSESDAREYPKAVAGCRWLLAWCRYFQSRFLTARELFELASAQLPADDAPEALWMAIVCLDRVVRSGDNARLTADLDQLIDRFLGMYPSSPHAPKLILTRALAADKVDYGTVQELMLIPSSSEVYDDARRQAAVLLYRLFKAAGPGEERNVYGNEYVTLAVALLAADTRVEVLDELVGRELFIARSRRVLEVTLSDGIGRLGAARSTLAGLEDLDADLAQYANELDCRRVQERLQAGDPRKAADFGNIVWARDSKSVWSRYAQQLLFKFGLQHWKTNDEFAADQRHHQDMVVRFGMRLLEEYRDDEEALRDPSIQSIHVSVADALMGIWQRSEQVDTARRAFTMFSELLIVRPRDGKVLYAVGILGEEVGETEAALDAWRTLAAAADVGVDRWYEAKLRLIVLLAYRDPARAREVMDQHKHLHPEYGPDPWGTRLRGLDARLARDAEADRDEGDGS